MGDRLSVLADSAHMRPARVVWKAIRRSRIRDRGERARQRDRDALREPKLFKKRARQTTIARRAEDVTELDRAIRAALRMSAPGIPRSAREAIAGQVAQVAVDPEHFDAATDRVIDVVQSTDADTVLPGTWLTFRHVLVRHGLLRAWVEVRDHARRGAHAHFAARPREPETAWWATKAHLDIGQAEGALETFRRLADLDEAHRAVPYLRRYLHAMGVDAGKGRRSRLDPPTGTDDAFGMLIRERRVAVVGPAASEQDQGPAIDAHDIVVRLNLISRAKLPDPRHGGARTDVTYLGRTATRRSTTESTPNDFSEVTFVCAKIDPPGAQPYGTATLRLFGDSMKGLRRVLFAGSSPNLAPGTLFDLLRFEPARITVFNTNFYLADNLYYDGYTGTGFARPGSFFGAAASHELFDQIHLVRNVAAGATVAVDEGCRAAISLTDHDAATRYELTFNAAHWG